MDAEDSFPNLRVLEDAEESQVSAVVLFLYVPTSNPLFFSHHAWPGVAVFLAFLAWKGGVLSTGWSLMELTVSNQPPCSAVTCWV